MTVDRVSFDDVKRKKRRGRGGIYFSYLGLGQLYIIKQSIIVTLRGTTHQPKQVSNIPLTSKVRREHNSRTQNANGKGTRDIRPRSMTVVGT